MAGPDALLHAIFALAPPCVLAFYVAALVFGICMLRESVVFSHNKFRNVVIGAILAVAGIYVCPCSSPPFPARRSVDVAFVDWRGVHHHSATLGWKQLACDARR